jgi:ankyrin repeat protein
VSVFAAAESGDVVALATQLDADPAALDARKPPYDWTLLHAAAAAGQLVVVEELLQRGLKVNTRETGDNSYAMHWAAAAGHFEVVRQLANAGGDVIGAGDDHGLEVIGWATCFDGCHDLVADFLVRRGAHHHIFSAIAMDLEDEVRKIVATDPGALAQRMSRNENHQLPLHFAVARVRPAMVELLIELGADPLGVDGSGHLIAAYATQPDVDRPVMEAIASLTARELESARRGQREVDVRPIDLLAALALKDFETASRVAQTNGGLLHMFAKRDDGVAVAWLLDHGADVNALWSHWGAVVTPLHLAAGFGHVDVVRQLLDAGADTSVRDSTHDGDPLSWARHFARADVVALLDGPG